MQSMDAELLKRCFIAGANNLERNKEYINELNVFPVPDGDTGTNMTMTIQSAAKAVAAIEEPDMASVCKAISSGSLRGARGNSGVILSQLLRGFCRVVMEQEAIDTAVLAQAFVKASETAYKAVMKPKEGTILTVAREMADRMKELAPQKEDVRELLGEVVAWGDEALARTPEQLPVLKEAGVVDSGGQGLMTALKGALAVLEGRETGEALLSAGESAGAVSERAVSGKLSTDDIRFGYCTEFIKAFLESIGDSIVCVADEDMVKVHVHTNHPGQAFEKGLTYGSLSRMKVDNMREEHEEKLIKDASKIAAMEKLRGDSQTAAEKPARQPHKETAFIAVCAGAGLAEIFRGLGADYVIEGGQTMNPSTEDLLEAIEMVNADHVFILPNNKNIILAAELAAGILEGTKLYVIPTKTIPQGITALINYNEGSSPEENAEAMKESLASVRSGEVTYAVRNTSVEGREIREGDIMGIGDSGILAVGPILNETTLEMLKKMTAEDSELITVYRGEDVEEADAEALCSDIRSAFPQCEVELQDGGQPVYYYILSVE